jgi:metallo-beta-lactamase family protein
VEAGDRRANAPSVRILVDCGMFQGSAASELKNRRDLPFDPRELDAVVLTHAHLDHSGRLPLLAKGDMKAPVFCTPSTIPLTDILLKDAAHLQLADTLWRTKERRKRGCGPGRLCAPLFTEADVMRLVQRMRSVRIGEQVVIAQDKDGTRVSLEFVEAGHIIGSASVVLRVRAMGVEKVAVFSGDVGVVGTPILKDPSPPSLREADVIVMESTYGDRDHKPLQGTLDEFSQIISQAYASGGKVLIPSFAVGRTQTLIYDIARLREAGKIPTGMPVYVDSPMGIEATRVYELDPSLFDDEARHLRQQGKGVLRFPGLTMLRTGDESRSINQHKGPAVIIAGAGMCTGGRILHHLRYHANNPNNHIIIVGFQAEGTLGRRIVERQEVLRISGDPVLLRAKVHTLGGLSAHAGQSGLMHWLDAVVKPMAKVPQIVLTHGEDKPRQALASLIQSRHGVWPRLPRFEDRLVI